jgi:hypothetical protein
MRVGVIQSNYVPWKGYFDIVNDVDLFVFYDDIQYTKNDWRNRNRVKTPRGPAWLTIPTGGDLQRRICDVLLPLGNWGRRHWRTLVQNYQGARFFSRYRDFFEDVYLGGRFTHLSELNQFLITHIAKELLGSRARFADSREYGLPAGERTERLIALILKTGARCYVSGPTARDYLDESRIRGAGIELVYKDYSGYPEYAQPFPPFVHQVSILDTLFCCGPESPRYIWGWRDSAMAARESTSAGSAS